MEEKENISSVRTVVSLKERFETFRKKRILELKNKKALKDDKNDLRKDPRFPELLREKFLSRAKHYIGVPYARRYHDPGTELYNSPLFLDCCALIRQVVWDLREDFGFTLARWNQAYQYDVLPEEIPFEALRPGDLIFYSATFYDKRKRPQIHEMVHVEIFIGGETGEQSLGSRWQKGRIQVFDSYKFVSTSYYDIKFHYKSIDSWLAGACVSHCTLHPWRDDRKDVWLPKGSIFAEEEEAEEQADHDLEADETLFAVGTGNNAELVEATLQKKGWTSLPHSHSFSSKCRFKWTQTHGEIDYYAFQEGVNIVNHFPNANLVFTSKGALTATARLIPEFPLPETFDLSDAADLMRFLQVPDSGTWVVKPLSLNQGRGIRLVRDVAEFKTQLRTGESRTDLVVQRYIENPLLLDGRKFDLRMYFLIARCKPYRVFLYQNYYARLSLNPYTLNDDDTLTHLTNASQQKKHPAYAQRKEESIRGRADLGLSDVQLESVETAVISALRALMQVSATKLIAKFGFFELFGLDVMLSDDLKVHILEINSNPALFVDTQAQAGVIPRMVEDTVELVLRLHSNGPEKYDGIKYSLIFSEEITSES